MRPSNKTWSLTVRRGSLHLDAPHGSFGVRAIAPAVMPVVTALPDGTDVECEGAFDGGGTITHLVVTKVRRILKDMSGRVMQLPDVIVAADGRLAAARARIHFAAGRIDDAVRDVAALLALGDDQAVGEFERLPPAHQEPLRDALVAWQAARPASWRALKHVPLARWTDAHVEQAVEQALANGGVFGAAPGTRIEILLAELERRGRPVKTLAKQTQRLRRAQATEGDTFHRLAPELDDPHVIGADDAGVYVRGTVRFGESVVQVGAYRRHDEDRRVVIVHHALDGRELQRWVGVHADRIVGSVALQIEADTPAAVRLADGKRLCAFAHRIEHHDGELLWGIHARDPKTRRMRSEIRHIATGHVIAKLGGWVDDVTWNAQHIFVHGSSPQTLTREGKLVRAAVPPAPDTIEIETAGGRHPLPAAHAPWLFGDWASADAGGWIVHHRHRELFVAPSEPGAAWVQLELAASATRVEVAPPWLAFHHASGPIILIALAEVMSAQELRIDGKRFARRAKAPPALAVAPAVVAWYERLVEHGVAPRLPAAARDAHLFRTLGNIKRVPDDALASVLADHAPACLSHADYYVDADDDLFDRLTELLAADNVRVRELAREQTDVETDDDDDDRDCMLVIEVARGGKRLQRRCGWSIRSVMTAVDAMLARLDAARRLYALTDYGVRCSYLAITPAQHRALVADGIAGLRATARER